MKKIDEKEEGKEKKFYIKQFLRDTTKLKKIQKMKKKRILINKNIKNF